LSNKVALIILDGFGISPEPTGNAILNARTPNLDTILPKFPKALLKASAEEVGLPWGEFGSSEVGHTTIGLGRVILQNLPQINNSFSSGNFAKKPIFNDILTQIDQGSAVNLIFVLSNGGVHGNMEHAISLIKLIKQQRKNARIFLHLITDGRDTAEKSAGSFLKILNHQVGKLASIASIMGRFYAMDRDKNWDRTQVAYNAILGQAKQAMNPEQVIDVSYKTDKTDEFIDPYCFGETTANLEKDIFIFTNFRTDRAIQLSRAFVDPALTEIKRKAVTNRFYSMTTYDDNLGLKVLFTNIELNDRENCPLSDPLVKILANNQKSQFHIAETEKYAHVTYFFSGGISEPYMHQYNKMIPSKKLQSYDVFPQMGAQEITSEIISASEQGYDFILANYANGDMVGHSGNLTAATQAVEIMDKYIGKMLGSLLKKQYKVIICSDHGNCDEMIDFNSGKPNKEHTLNPVPFILCDLERAGQYSSKTDFFSLNPQAVLADISPTILSIMNIEKPDEMTGLNITESLI